MEPHWVNISDRKPPQHTLLQVLVVEIENTTRNLPGSNCYNIDYALARQTPNGTWTFSPKRNTRG